MPADFIAKNQPQADAAFDRLWRDTTLLRREAYVLMQQIMGMTAAEAHIGQFDVEQCKQLIEKLSDLETTLCTR